MATRASRLLRVLDRVATHYREALNDIDAEAKARLAEADVQPSCRQGCSHCCYYKVEATYLDAVSLALYLMRVERWEGLKPTLARLAREDFWNLDPGEPCPFLDPRAGTCTVYEVRPQTCRLHLVTSDPEHCRNESDIKPDFVDLDPLRWRLGTLEVAILRRAKLLGYNDYLPKAVYEAGCEIEAARVRVERERGRSLG